MPFKVDEQAEHSPKLFKEIFYFFFLQRKNSTSSREFIRRRHIPWRRYLLQVAMRGISATEDPWILHQCQIRGNLLLVRKFQQAIRGKLNPLKHRYIANIGIWAVTCRNDFLNFHRLKSIMTTVRPFAVKTIDKFRGFIWNNIDRMAETKREGNLRGWN